MISFENYCFISDVSDWAGLHCERSKLVSCVGSSDLRPAPPPPNRTKRSARIRAKNKRVLLGTLVNFNSVFLLYFMLPENYQKTALILIMRRLHIANGH